MAGEGSVATRQTPHSGGLLVAVRGKSKHGDGKDQT